MDVFGRQSRFRWSCPEQRPQTSNLASPTGLSWLKGSTMSRIRHCVECPNCLTRYLIGSSPCRNGSRLVSCLSGDEGVHILFCSCGRPPVANRWSELKKYVVSSRAYDRGYGTPEEIVLVGDKKRNITGGIFRDLEKKREDKNSKLLS